MRDGGELEEPYRFLRTSTAEIVGSIVLLVIIGCILVSATAFWVNVFRYKPINEVMNPCLCDCEKFIKGEIPKGWSERI